MVIWRFYQMPSTVHNVHSVSVTLENIAGENTASFLLIALRTRPKLCFRCTIHENFINFRGFGTIFSLFARCGAVFATKARKTDCRCDVCKALPGFPITKRGRTKKVDLSKAGVAPVCSKRVVMRDRKKDTPRFSLRLAFNAHCESGSFQAAHPSRYLR